MNTFEHAIDVKVPVRVAYNQWTQFEEFPHFMEGIKEVRQLDEEHLHWRGEVAGVEEEWTAEITEQIPDQRIAWRSTSGAENAGVVTFHYLDEDRTRVMLQIAYQPEGVVEHLGDMLGVMERRLRGDLERFKEYVEGRGHESGAWRGVIPKDLGSSTQA